MEEIDPSFSCPMTIYSWYNTQLLVSYEVSLAHPRTKCHHRVLGENAPFNHGLCFGIPSRHRRDFHFPIITASVYLYSIRLLQGYKPYAY